ncbi:FUSC family protein [Streptosporangium sp. NPDC004379]|uniref:FUSC family protein n=1 Tax=Streptosporangium sp. NPDC004379 TaxID=3366189 RepID=UPI00369DED20
MPRLFRSAADRLADAAPGWLVETVRPVPARPDWWPMIRMALAVTVPLLVGAAAGNVTLGLLPSMGAMGPGLADRGGPYREKVARIGLVGLGGAAGYAIGATVRGHGWWTVPVIMVVSVASALISTVGAKGSLAGLQLLVMAVIGSGIPLPGGPLPGAALFLLGTAWVIVLGVADRPLRSRNPEETATVQVYRALGRLIDDRDAGALAAFDAALESGYDAVFGARSASGGQDPAQTRLIALLNQASLIRNALISLGQEGLDPPEETAAAVEEIVAALDEGRPPHRPPRPDGDSPALRALNSAVDGAVELASGGDVEAEQLPYRPVGHGERFRKAWAKMWYGHFTRLYAVRLALCMGVAAAISGFGLFERSYWMVLTVALVLKPDFGSVFARALQRALGTFAGTLVAVVVLLVIPYGPLILVPIAVFAALIPYGLQRNWGLMSTFQAPLVLFLVDLLTRGGPRLAEIRLVDTLAGCLIVLLLGYLPWPGSWHAPVRGAFADAVSATARYLRDAFDPGSPDRPVRRRRAYEAMADLRAVFQRAVTEPPAVSRRITTWMPAMTALEKVADTTAATVARAEYGAPPPPPEAVRTMADSLEEIAESIRRRRVPAEPGPAAEGAPERLADAIRALRDTVSGRHAC